MKFFYGFLKEFKTIDRWLKQEKGFENWAEVSGFNNWLDRREFALETPYNDLYTGMNLHASTPPQMPNAVQFFRSMGFKVKSETVTVEEEMSSWDQRYGGRLHLVNPIVDFPPPMLLPKFTMKPPAEDDRKAYGAYLYDKKFEPYRVRQGKPNLKKALQVLQLSESGMNDATIARTQFNLQSPYPGEGVKPKELQMVRDCKVAARKAIAAIFPGSSKNN